MSRIKPLFLSHGEIKDTFVKYSVYAIIHDNIDNKTYEEREREQWIAISFFQTEIGKIRNILRNDLRYNEPLDVKGALKFTLFSEQLIGENLFRSIATRYIHMGILNETKRIYYVWFTRGRLNESKPKVELKGLFYPIYSKYRYSFILLQ